MKKLLVVLIAIVMIFGFATTALAADTLNSAYPDFSGQDQTVQDAFMKLTALDVFDGYLDGTIRPNSNITRAEFAKITCVLAGMQDSANILINNPSKYSDVAKGAWYTGWINLATSQGFIKGYPDGTYKPNSNISMQEALTVLLRIAGYTDNLVGPWPLDYIAQGGKLGITDDVSFSGAAAATRASVAVMAANLLDVNVVYWDADKARHVEDLNSDDETMTVLQDRFGGYTDDVTIEGWGFDDFADQELYIDSNATNDELATKYWISNGYVINTLGNAQATLIYNSDDEIVYIDVTSTTVYSDDVTIVGSVTSIEVDGKTVKLADDVVAPSAGDYTAAKVYYNEDGKVYLVQNLAGLGTTPAVFKKYNTNTNRLEVYAGAGSSNISIADKDVAFLKAGYFITASNLKDGDILNAVPAANGSDLTFIVTSFKVGELSKATATKLTIAGTGLVWVNNAVTANASYFSDDQMATDFVALSMEALDSAYGTNVKYASKLLNPYDLDLVVFTGEDATNTLYGIVTDIKANIDGAVSGLTVLGADGEEVDYTIVKGDDPRPVYAQFSVISAANLNDVTFGSYIEAKVSENGTIDTDDITMLVDPTTAGLAAAPGDTVVDSGVNDINSNRINLDGVYYTLTNDTLVFQTTTDINGFDDAEVIDVADLKAADAITGDVLAFVENGVVGQIFMLDTDLNSASAFGVVDDVEYRSGKWYATLLGGSEYTTNSSFAAYVDTQFVMYAVSGGELSIVDTIVEVDGTVLTIDGTSLGDNDLVANGNAPYTASVVNESNPIITINGVNYTTTNDTVFYVIDDGEITVGDIYDYDDDTSYGLFAITTDDGIAYANLQYVFIVNFTPTV